MTATQPGPQDLTPSEYVHLHMPLLTRYSRSLTFRPSWVEPDEFQSDLVDQILTSHHTFRQGLGGPCPYCSGSGCSTWIGWRARKAGSNQRRVLHRDFRWMDRTVTPEDLTDLPSHDGPRVMFARARVAELWELATPEQREALVSKWEGWTGSEVRKYLGISLGGRNYRLHRLIEQLNEVSDD